MKRVIVGLMAVALVLSFTSLASASLRGAGKGWPDYVDIHVTWDPSMGNYGDWNVYNAETGSFITGCSNCLNMDYDFKFIGKTLQFEEVYVPGVEAYPQTHHVVLHDQDGDNIYTGSITARYDYQPGYIYMDVVEYKVTTNGNGNVTYFEYWEHEHKKPVVRPGKG